MANFEPNKAGIQALHEQIGEQIRTIVNDTAQETADQDLDVAVDTLHQRLNDVEGLNFERSWAQHAVETLRRGENLTINLG